MNRVEENQQPAGEDRSAFNAQPTSADSFAAMIGTKNLKIIIITMPFVFLIVVGLIIAVFGRPGERASAAPAIAQSTSIHSPENGGGFILPGDAVIESMALDGDRLAVHVNMQDGAMIVIYDLQQEIVMQTIPVRRTE